MAVEVFDRNDKAARAALFITHPSSACIHLGIGSFDFEHHQSGSIHIEENSRIKMASATLPAEVQKVANEGVVKLFGRWDHQE